ncbi:hypothetical protein GCM10020258_48450 [Sphingomonas yabuuchiae]
MTDLKLACGRGVKNSPPVPEDRRIFLVLTYPRHETAARLSPICDAGVTDDAYDIRNAKRGVPTMPMTSIPIDGSLHEDAAILDFIPARR